MSTDPADAAFWWDRWKEAAEQREHYHNLWTNAESEVARLRAKVARVEKLAEEGRYHVGACQCATCVMAPAIRAALADQSDTRG